MKHPTQEFPQDCTICTGKYRKPKLADAVVGRVNCTGSCNGYIVLFEGDIRAAVSVFEAGLPESEYSH